VKGLNRLARTVAVTVILASAYAFAADEPADASAKISLAELSEKAELIALAQIRDTDYFYRREYPVSGSAYLKVLIPYKMDAPQDLIEVNEEGLHENECYFPNPTVFEEGRRYLLFLRRNPDDPEQYLRLEQGCAMEVFVDQSNQYALKYPVSGVELSDSLSEFAQEMRFSDTYSLVEEEAMSPDERDALLEAGLIAREGDKFRYTHGISLSKFRELISGAKGIPPAIET
jgi:hypothetical protein